LSSYSLFNLTMPTTIKCPKCGNKIEISEALKKDLEEKVLQQTQAKHQQDIEKLEKEKEELIREKNKELEEVKEKILRQAKEEATIKAKKIYDAKIELTKEDALEQAKQNKELREEIKGLFKQLRETKGEKDKIEIEYQKKLMEEEGKIKQKARQEAEEEFSLEIAQKNKQMADLQKQLKEAERKAQQGSQQLQGEVLELELEEILRKEFIYDQIKEVPKGIKGADVIQVVRTNTGIICGTIVWELKNTKNWTKGWIAKLKEDQRFLKAELAVLVSKVLPETIKAFGVEDGVWVSDIKSSISLAHALRQQLIKVQSINQANKGRSNKANLVYGYLISNEFKQRIEIWVEYFKNRRDELEKERAYYMKKWQKEEKSIVKVVENTVGIYGDLQGLIGNALPKIQNLELPEEIEK